MKMIQNTHNCNKEEETIPLFPCRIFGNVTVGYYCVICHQFIPKPIAPEVDVIKKLMETCRNGIEKKEELTCAQ